MKLWYNTLIISVQGGGAVKHGNKEVQTQWTKNSI